MYNILVKKILAIFGAEEFFFLKEKVAVLLLMDDNVYMTIHVSFAKMRRHEQLSIWKSDLSDKIKRNFFRAAVVFILLYGCTTCMLTKRMKKKLDGNHIRMLHAVLNKSWRQHPSKQQLYGHLPPITKTTQVRRSRRAAHCWRSKDKLIRDVFL